MFQHFGRGKVFNLINFYDQTRGHYHYSPSIMWPHMLWKSFQYLLVPGLFRLYSLIWGSCKQETDKVALAQSTGLDPKQINNWFINQRKRHWKPSEDMQFVVMDGSYPHNAGSAAFYMDGHFMGDALYRHLGPWNIKDGSVLLFSVGMFLYIWILNGYVHELLLLINGLYISQF